MLRCMRRVERGRLLGWRQNAGCEVAIAALLADAGAAMFASDDPLRLIRCASRNACPELRDDGVEETRRR